MRFNKIKIILFSSLLLVLFSCQKRSNYQGKTYWISREAGVYSLYELRYIEYKNNEKVKDEIIQTGKSTFILQSIEAEGTNCFFLEIYGSYVPQFLNYPSAGFRWSTEGDDKRLTFGIDDPGVGYIPTATLTVDKMGKKKQTWNYIINKQVGPDNIYIRYEYKVSRN